MKIKHIILLTISIALSVNLTAQCSTQNKFQLLFSGSGNETAHSIDITQDDGYVVAGKTTTFGAGSTDLFVMKLDVNGNVEWSFAYGGTGIDEGNSVVVKQTDDLGYVVTGRTHSFGAGSIYDSYMLKLDANGVIQWERAVTGAGYDQIRDVKTLANGDILLFGSSSTTSSGNNDLALIRLSSTGSTVFHNSYGTTGREHGVSVCELSNGNLLCIGETNITDTRNQHLMCTDANGTVLWSKEYGIANFEDFYFEGIQTKDGNILAIGYSYGYGNNSEIVLTKLDTNGNVIWNRAYGGSGNDEGVSVAENSAGELIISANTTSFGGDDDILIIRTDASGNVIQAKTIGGTANDVLDFASSSIAVTSNDQIVIAAGTNGLGAIGEDVLVIKTDSCLESGCNETDAIISEQAAAISETNVSTITLTGSALSAYSSTRTIFSFTDNVLCLSNPVGIEEELSSDEVVLYPNPTNDNVSISLANTQSGVVRVYNAMGQLVKAKQFNRNIIELKLNGAAGIYTVQIETEAGVLTRKVIKE